MPAKITVMFLQDYVTHRQQIIPEFIPDFVKKLWFFQEFKLISTLIINLALGTNHLHTSLKVDLRQDKKGGFAFSRCLNGTFP